ncbi:MAG: hypothetical protein JST82_05350 [Bacteroidetes bacterium]|nr:hypothetical protein [Bacteroidota bacterium]
MYRIVLIAVLSLSLFSCVKKGNYTCTCTIDNSTITGREMYNDIPKKQAQDKCENFENLANSPSGSSSQARVQCILQ